jgi:large subunit ribosomal protein L24
MPSKFKPALAGAKTKSKIHKGDQVIVIAGKDKGKKGRVLRIITDKNRVLVEGIAFATKHKKPNQQTGQQGGIVKEEAAIHISNVMLMDSEGKATRAGFSIDAEGKKTRVARTNGVVIATAEKKQK